MIKTALKAILFAGANGAGKTTFARQYLPVEHPEVVYLNADEIRRSDASFDHPVTAGRELLRRLERSEPRQVSFAVETTLSYARRMLRWRVSGYNVMLHFIEVPSADFAVGRVASRVAAGGHDVPEEDIRRRFRRGLNLFEITYKPMVSEW